MSLIIGYVKDNKVYMATESQRRADLYQYSDSTETGSNVFYMPNNVLCGVFNLNVSQVLRTHPEWFDAFKDEPLTKQSIAQELLPILYNELNERHLILPNSIKDGKSNYDGTILLAQQDRLYCIDDDFSVVTIPRFCIIGSAANKAYARVITYDQTTDVEKMLYLALADGKRHSCYVKEPFYLFTTDSAEKKELKGE